MVISSMLAVTDGLNSLHHLNDALFDMVWRLPVNWHVLAQNVKDPDLMGQMQRAFNNFIQTGQVWALIIGLFIGYMLRGITA